MGALYAPLLLAAWLGAYLGAWSLPIDEVPLRLQHGHEFIFGFSAAIITGIVLTALPSWAATEEIRGRRLILLVALWLAGRIAFWAAPWLPALLPAIVDCLLFPALFLMLTPQLLEARNRLYLLLLPILAALFAANLLYHHGVFTDNPAQAGRALHLALYALIVLYVLKGGVLAPIFTGNALREKGRGDQAPFNMLLDTLAVAAVLLLAALDLAAAPAAWIGGSALACALFHGWRCARWQGWRVADVPLVLVMHLGFAWLIVAFVLKAVAELTGLVAEGVWVHAFTVGSLGMMMLGLMTRVSLRHTGRPLVVPRPMLAAFALMFGATVLRLASGVPGLGHLAIGLAALLWASCFVLYFREFWKVLIAPSAPHRP
ncbi:MAG: NnrS family protein [Burkholderiaceae bacterium]|nr:NnrS family protein [Sulfuritalea sp.]MCF8174257.1 NnrS family protein [Burkholderiaceae bacterium]MCF8184321.1 NnrS family protein [Polynucleobacter sp.]